jgi:hypothetical protein
MEQVQLTSEFLIFDWLSARMRRGPDHLNAGHTISPISLATWDKAVHAEGSCSLRLPAESSTKARTYRWEYM